jgi:2-hydroxychromene-2-carboxylate isomerase
VSATAELFFDPVCPFCWVTSRWIEEVAAHTGLEVTYRPISLRVLNADEDPTEPLGALHVRGHELLRVVTAAAEQHGDEVVGPLYTAIGRAIHEQPVEGATVEGFGDVARIQTGRPDDLSALLRQVGLPEGLVAAVGDEGYDDAIRKSTEVALERAGDDVGTPVLTIGPPDGPSFFGPILSEVPTGDEAVRIWEAISTLAAYRPFTEFKRSLRELPDTLALTRLR